MEPHLVNIYKRKNSRNLTLTLTKDAKNTSNDSRIGGKSNKIFTPIIDKKLLLSSFNNYSYPWWLIGFITTQNPNNQNFLHKKWKTYIYIKIKTWVSPRRSPIISSVSVDNAWLRHVNHTSSVIFTLVRAISLF